MKRIRDAFTLIELLVVIGIIMLLAGLLLPALSKAKETARKTKAKAEVKQLDIAWKAVQSDYRTWTAAFQGTPMSGADSGVPKNMDANAVSYLNCGNSKGTAYLELDATMVNGFTDPWYSSKAPNNQNFYRFSLNVSTVQVPGPGGAYSPIDRSVACWSKGPDGVDGSAGVATTDDIMSWQ